MVSRGRAFSRMEEEEAEDEAGLGAGWERTGEEGEEGGEEGEDVVVREIDVWLTQALAPERRDEGGAKGVEGESGREDEGGDAGSRGLYLVQYPLRPKDRPYPLDEECRGVRLKPRNQRLELELAARGREEAGMIDEKKDREWLKRVGLLRGSGASGGKGVGKKKERKQPAGGRGSRSRTTTQRDGDEGAEEEGEDEEGEGMDVDGDGASSSDEGMEVGPKDLTTASLRELRKHTAVHAADYVTAEEGGEDLALRLVLSSGPPAEHKGTYCVGVLRGDGLHLTPLDAVVQLRPSMRHVDAANKLRADREGDGARASGSARGGKGAGAGGVGVAGDGDSDSMPQLLVTSVKKRETDRQEQLRKQSHSYLKNQMDKEEWVQMDMVRKEQAGDVYEQLFADPSAGPVPTREGQDAAPWFVAHLGKSIEDVLGTDQGPGSELQAGEGVVVQDDILAGSALNPVRLEGLLPEERVKLLLTHCHVLPYMTVRQNMDDTVLDGKILHYLQQYGCLVQGCWVESAECRPLAGSAAALHNWLCLKFALGNGHIAKAELGGITEPPRDRVREHLQTLAHMAGGGSWEFKVPKDARFLAQHPDLAERHDDAWKERSQGIVDEFERVCKAKKSKAKAKPVPRAPEAMDADGA